jgi:hypothetical protein
MSDLFATSQLQDIFLHEFHLDVAETAPKGDANITVTVETSETTGEEVNGRKLFTTDVSVIATLVGQESEDEKSMQLQSTVTVVYRTVPDTDGGEAMLTAIRRRSLNDGYCFVRDHAMQMTSLSPMRRLILPSIDLDSLV